MSWPSPQDYNEAIQLPRSCFEDPELRQGQAQVDALGLPKAISGAFASVYKLVSPQRSWAIRCFLQNFGDQESRYHELSAVLGQGSIPHTVGFQYVPRGILIHGTIYPILKMEWVNGKSLDQFVDEHCTNQELLYRLADRFRALCRDINSYGIAHGDLQHGNIIVVPDGFRLVDYDGSFVPALQGLKSNELGHPNYQHPRRTGDHFGPYLDNFSAWIIYGSLACLSVDPGLWQVLRGGDECLLFRHADYQAPCASLAFSVLEHHPSDYVKNISRVLRSLLRLAPHQVPGLDDALPSSDDLPLVPRPSDISAALTRAAESRHIAIEFVSSAVKLPSWPKREFYQEAVKQPSMAFRDKELKRSQYTFEFAHGKNGIVFHLKGVHRQIAVKCFFKDNPEREARYAAIQQAVSSPLKNYLCSEIEYIKEGIYAQGRWFPILKMEWISGQPLDQYLWGRQQARDSTATDTVLYRFRQLMQALYASGIAHGDLSPSNILVTGQGIKLVDYDNMYVPALNGMQSQEFGEALLQPATRSLGHFGPFLDNWSAWVIDNALTFLSIYPDAYYWSWQDIAFRCRGDEFMTAPYIVPPDYPGRDFHNWEIKPEIRKRAQLMHVLQQFPLEEIPPLITDFSSNVLKREALISEVNRVLRRYVGTP